MSENRNEKDCCFIGHRAVANAEETRKLLYREILKLIKSESVRTFLFGSRSEFNELCHAVVTDLQIVYPDIKRVMYSCRSECACMESEREKTNSLYSRLLNRPIKLLGYEEERKFPYYLTSGRASYVQRNKSMIDDSDYCIFYYCDGYTPKSGGRSGTRMAYEYAEKVQRKGSNFKIINVYRPIDCL